MSYSIKSNIRVINTDPELKDNCFRILDNSSGKKFDLNNSSYQLIKFINESDADYTAIPRLINEKFNLPESATIAFINYLTMQGILYVSETKIYNQNILLPYTTYNPLRRVSLEVTERCNLRCIHCYGNFGHSLKRILSYKEIEDLACDLDILNSYQLALTGGEFFLHPDYDAIFNFFKNKGYELTVFTNGFYTDRIIEFAQKHQDFMVKYRISVDGFSDTHNKIRQNNLSYQNAINTIVKLKQFANADVVASMAINKLNYLELNDLIEFMQNQYGVKLSYDLAFPTQFNQANKDWLFGLDEFDNLKHILPMIFTLDRYIKEKPRGTFRCIGGREGAAITADKKMKICTGAMDDIYYFGDINESSVVNLWENPPPPIAFYRREKLKDIEKCNSCSLQSKCNFTNCRVQAGVWTGNPKNPNPILCYRIKGNI